MPPEPWEGFPRFALLSKDGVQLTELVVNPGPGKTLSLYEQDFLEGLVLQAGVAVENAHYHERAVEWARVQQDLDAARAIQRSLLPQQMTEISGYSVAVRSSTCYEVGGDYVDIVSLPDGGEIMVVADVAGKGLASAIVATSFRSAFRAMALAGLPLAELAARMNQQHYGEGPGGPPPLRDRDLPQTGPGDAYRRGGQCRPQPRFSAFRGRRRCMRLRPAAPPSGWSR
jgi:sigma-B regulation protein RsbU (phosphoserine phosphatase)